MENFRRTLMIVISSLLLAISSDPCSAADSAFRDLGGPAETPPERALLVFTSNSTEQLDYLSTSDAATAALRAANSTAARAAKSLIAIENGAVTISFPAISPDFQGNIAKGLAGMIVKAELISGTF